MPAKVVMIQGTSSHVGKSVLATAFCRILSRRGVRVAPFKGMNMSNNAWVTEEGGEIAYAQAVQAWASGVTPTVQMNPVLLKPMADRCSQVVVLGKVRGTVPAVEFSKLREELLGVIRESLEALIDRFEVVVIEGAGSPAEINLRSTDLANMEVARMVHAPVILVADIERGGVFAHLVGTLELLPPEERALVRGFLINKFRGEEALLRPGLEWLEQRTGRPVLGVIPYIENLGIPEEDSLAIGVRHRNLGRVPGLRPGTLPAVSDTELVHIQVIRYPTVANFNDFDPLHQESDVAVEYLTVSPGNGDLPDLVILPGSKSTMSDLVWLRSVGLDRYLSRCVEAGVPVLGICGGFQMLGQWIYDPAHVESEEAAMPGLGVLPTSTLFLPQKLTAQVKGIHLESGEPIRGFEIHSGRLQGSRRGKPVFRLTERAGVAVEELDGCALPEKKIWGTYLHGLFEAEGFRRYFLNRLRIGVPTVIASEAKQSHRGIASVPLPLASLGVGVPRNDVGLDPYDRLADVVREHLFQEKLLRVIPWIPSL